MVGEAQAAGLGGVEAQVEGHVAVPGRPPRVVGVAQPVLDPQDGHGGVGGDGAEAGGDLAGVVEDEALAADVQQAGRVLVGEAAFLCAYLKRYAHV